MANRKPPAVVAELGRPETPSETAERRADASRARRSNQTLFNLAIATIASLGVVLVLVVVVVRPTPAPSPGIDFAATAVEAQDSVAEVLLVPDVPAGWTANAARFGSQDQVETWYIGFITASTQFIAFNQGINANPTWTASTLGDAPATGQVTIGGISWVTYDQRTADSPGNYAFSMATELGANTLVLHGTAPDSEFEQLAIAIAQELDGK